MGNICACGRCHLKNSVFFPAKLGQASCSPQHSSSGHYRPIRDDIMLDFYMIFFGVLALEAVAQNAEVPVYHFHSCTLGLHLILNVLILTFKAI